jgi:polyhydroxybutyrate depolymerase
LVPYEGGAVARDEAAHGRAASAASTAKFWADRDGCTSSGTKVKPDASASDGTTTETTTYAGCREGSAVVLETVRGGGHTWPGGLAYMPERVIGRTSRDWDASEEIWAFFRDKRR